MVANTWRRATCTTRRGHGRSCGALIGICENFVGDLGHSRGRCGLVIVGYVHYKRNMDNEGIILALGALAQATRLDVFRLLVRHEPAGIAAGEIARQLEIPHNTLSAHLGILARSGLVQSQRKSRSIIYRADLERFRAMMLFLVSDCCGGNRDQCAPLINELISCCPAKPAAFQH